MDVRVCRYEVCGFGYDKCVIEVRVCVDVCGYGRYSIGMGVTQCRHGTEIQYGCYNIG